MSTTPKKLRSNHTPIAPRAAGTHVRGYRGEDFVASILRRQKWHILARNFRCPGSELDIIALKESCLLFIEVKLRASIPSHFEDLLSYRKKTALLRGVKRFLSLQDLTLLKQVATIRLDLVVLNEKKPPNYRWFVNALALDE